MTEHRQTHNTTTVTTHLRFPHPDEYKVMFRNMHVGTIRVLHLLEQEQEPFLTYCPWRIVHHQNDLPSSIRRELRYILGGKLVVLPSRQQCVAAHTSLQTRDLQEAWNRAITPYIRFHQRPTPPVTTSIREAGRWFGIKVLHAEDVVHADGEGTLADTLKRIKQLSSRECSESVGIQLVQVSPGYMHHQDEVWLLCQWRRGHTHFQRWESLHVLSALHATQQAVTNWMAYPGPTALPFRNVNAVSRQMDSHENDDKHVDAQVSFDGGTTFESQNATWTTDFCKTKALSQLAMTGNLQLAINKLLDIEAAIA